MTEDGRSKLDPQSLLVAWSVWACPTKNYRWQSEQISWPQNTLETIRFMDTCTSTVKKIKPTRTIQDDKLEWHLHNRFLQEHEPTSCQSAAAVCETTTYPANKIAQTRRPRQISMTFQRKCVVFLACSIDILLSINSHALFGKYSGIPDRSLINILAAWQQQETSAAKCVEELFSVLQTWKLKRWQGPCFLFFGKGDTRGLLFWYFLVQPQHLPFTKRMSEIGTLS